MKKSLVIKFLIFIVPLFFMVTIVNASSNYNDFDNRKMENKNVYDKASELPQNAINSYKDKSLKDMADFSGKTLSNSEMSDVLNIASNVTDSNSDIDKIRDFYTEIIRATTLGEKSSLSKVIESYKVDKKMNGSLDEVMSFLVALSRSQNIPTRIITGEYNDEYLDDLKWDGTAEKVSIVAFYVNGNWIYASPYAEFKDYSKLEDTEKENAKLDNYFDMSYLSLSERHVLLNYLKGSTDPYYIYDNGETRQLVSFLEIKYQNKTNGKRANSSYNKNNSFSWFENSNSSKSDGYGKLVSLSYSKNRNYYGKLVLKNYSKLQKVSIPNNKISGAELINNKLLTEVVLNNNNMTKLLVSGSNNLAKLNALSNPLTSVSYQYGKNKKTANVKTTAGGTIAINLVGNTHTLVASPKKDYKFLGWYSGSKRLSASKTYKFNNSNSFTYTAKFGKIKKQVKVVKKKKAKKPFIKVSIKKQKLYYYNAKGKLVYKTKVVTGKKGKYSTPTGTYKVRAKMRNVNLVGDDYVNFVKYWMLLDWKSQIGIHDASWRSYFGGKIYKKYGSHGCVNLPKKAAKYIYKKVPVGTTVKIVK